MSALTDQLPAGGADRRPAPLITIVAEGQPAGQGALSRNRYGATYEISRGHAAWRKAVRAHAETAMAQHPDTEFPITGPVALSACWTLPCPKSIPWSRRPCTVRSPDIDHLQRAVYDALSLNIGRRKAKDGTVTVQKGAGVFRDDSQIVELREPFGTYYVGDPRALLVPGVVVRVWSVVA